jgi:PAS domain S-box-containing protein
VLKDYYATIVIVACLAFLLLMYCVAALWRRMRQMQCKLHSLQHDLDEIETVYANAPLGLATLDNTLRYVRINKLLAQINGVAVEDHIGKTIREIVPDLAEQAEKPFVQVLRSGRPISGIIFEGTTSSKPQVSRVWRENVHPIFSKTKKVVGVNVSVEEITEEKKLNDALRASELRERKRATELEVVMNATPAAVFIAHDTACRDVTGNKEAILLLRLRPGESPSLSAPGARPFKVFADGVWVPTEKLPLQVAASTGKEVRAIELSIHFPDDKVIHVLMNAAPVRDELGNVIGAAAAFVDITEQKQANEALRKEAVRKDEFLAILAHELRNPLAAIQTGLDLMKHGSASTPSQSNTLYIMERQVSHLDRLIADLLDVSRIGSGKLELIKEE